jgi:leucyl-tRNA synthetase
MVKYNPKKIEKKWQKKWYGSTDFAAKDFSKKEKFYLLDEFPYPSGDGLHVGHCRPYIALDIIARKRRMQGQNVLFPMGWDAFGLPTENYAIKMGIQPAFATKKNKNNFKRQMNLLGLSFDWSREINTTDPAYYKWTQWIFLQLFKKGLAYKKKIEINWCPKDKIGLANEEVIAGKCERCGTQVEKRQKEQWLIKITKYADRLIKDLDLVDYPERVKEQQKNWIGRSEGVNLKNKVKDLPIEFETYDSIPQTFMAQTFTVIAPDHLLLKKLVEGTEYEKPVLEFAKQVVAKRMAGNYQDEKNMEGIFTGRYVENFCDTGRDLPIWVASYVVADYGTGIVNCSAHDERDFAFAKKYGIELHPVLFPKDQALAQKVKNLEVFYRQPDGILQEPALFQGMTWEQSRQPIIDALVKNGFGEKAVNYKLRDWVFSRQHYWGEPIPLIFCKKCGWQPVPEKDLPVKLPNVKKYEPTDTGESPLSAITAWVNIECPKCGGNAKRETDTMPNWAGSNWYYLRYTDPNNSEKLADAKKLNYWMPVDWYNGGMEHTTLHLLYSRFIFKFLWDISAVPKKIGSEPYKKRTSHGVILGPGGVKMSKSRGNVINPDEVVKKYGADTLRVYEMFIGPFDQMIPWDEKGIIGARRFIEKIYNLAQNSQTPISNSQLKILLHKTIKKVGEDIEAMKFNTAVSAMMEFANAWHLSQTRLNKKDTQKLLIILSPFAPHLTEELWQTLKYKGQCSRQIWPAYDQVLFQEEKIIMVISVNGKVRDKMEFASDVTQQEVESIVLRAPKVKPWLEGKQVKKVIFVPNKLINIVI